MDINWEINPSDTTDISEAVRKAAIELLDKAALRPGQSVIVGCSTSEVAGQRIGSSSSVPIGTAIFISLYDVFLKYDIFLAAQCCEHLNRAIIVERKAAANHQIVNVVPTPEAGGAFAAAAYTNFSDPVALESFEADAGLDIGSTLIGMHLKRVAVPLRLDVKFIGEAPLIAARTRPPLIGGSRASYNEGLL